MDSVLDEFGKRLKADRAAEIRTAIEQIAAVSAARVRAAFEQRQITGNLQSVTPRTDGRHAS